MITCLMGRPPGWGPGSVLAMAGILLILLPVLAVVGIPLAIAYAARDHGPRPIRWILRRFRTKTREV